MDYALGKVDTSCISVPYVEFPNPGAIKIRRILPMLRSGLEGSMANMLRQGLLPPGHLSATIRLNYQAYVATTLSYLEASSFKCLIPQPGLEVLILECTG